MGIPRKNGSKKITEAQRLSETRTLSGRSLGAKCENALPPLAQIIQTFSQKKIHMIFMGGLVF